MRGWRSLSWGLLLGTLGSCATLSEKDCKSGNWYDIGMRDGLQGQRGDRVEKHGEACREYGIQPDRAAYEKGRAEGLRSYCTPENGFRMGRSGATYPGGCPAALETPFLAKYESGRELHRLHARVEQVYREINDLENQMDREPDVTKRARLRERLRDRQRERDELQRRLTVLEVRGG